MNPSSFNTFDETLFYKYPKIPFFQSVTVVAYLSKSFRTTKSTTIYKTWSNINIRINCDYGKEFDNAILKMLINYTVSKLGGVEHPQTKGYLKHLQPKKFGSLTMYGI